VQTSTPSDHFTPGDATPSPWQRLARAAMSESWQLRLAFVGMMLVYAQTVFFDFVYDDIALILLNPWMRGWNQVHAIFTHTFWAFMNYQAAGGTNFYRPLTMFWLFLVNRIGHGAPGFFHVGVVLVHLVVMVEIYFLGRRLTKDAVVGAVAALLFGIHPTHIESVAWISGISDVLCAAFFLAALLGYLRWADDGRWYWLMVSLVCLEAALLSKEAAALLLVLIVLDRFRQSRGMDLFSRGVHAVYVSLPYILLTALHFSWQSHILAQRSTRMEGNPFEPSLALAPYALWWYLKKQVFPFPVSAHYTTIFEGSLTRLQMAASWVFFLAVFVLAVWVVRRSRAGQLLVVLFAATLLPVIAGVQALQLHDRYLYLPGIATAIGAAVLLRRVPLLREHRGRQFALLLAIAAILIPMSARETSYWSGDIRLFEHSIEVQPHTVLNLEVLYDAYIANGDDARAEQVLRRTVAEFPDRSRQWTRLALFCLHHDKPDEAALCARRAISITPVSKSLPASFDVLAQVELKRGNLPEAEMWAHRAVTADGSSTAHRTLAEIYAAEGYSARSSAEASAAMASDASYRTK